MKKRLLLFPALLAALFAGAAEERIIVVDEGIYGQDNGRLTYFVNDAVVSNQWFRDVNSSKLGDTPEDIIKVNDGLIAIAVNMSNIVQFIDCQGKAVAAVEDIPGCRKLATDGRYVYVTSYGHECKTDKGTLSFTKGFVAKIDVNTFKVTDAVEVGYEPEGIAYYDGCLFVANSGGYSFSEDHDYEQTVSVVDASTLKLRRTIDTGQINLGGVAALSGNYLCISSPGDYYEVPAAIIILDCRAALDGSSDKECFVKANYTVNNCTVDSKGNFYTLGSSYSFVDGGYTYQYLYINPKTAFATGCKSGISENDFPGAILSDIHKMEMPYGLYVNPYTGYFYATDAASYGESGTLYQWNPQGELKTKCGVYINPGHFLALDPNAPGSIDGICDDSAVAEEYYNVQGMRSTTPWEGANLVRMSDGSIRKTVIRRGNFE